MAGDFYGNLLSLWRPLQTIRSGRSELEYTHKINIENKNLDKFLDHWKNNEAHSCSDEMCGTTCRYCDDFYKDMP